VSTTVQIEGVKQTIAELRRVNPELKKAFVKDAKKIARPAIVVAQNRYKALQFPSGTYRAWSQRDRQLFPLSNSKMSRSVQVKVSGSKKAGAAIYITSANAGAGIFEFARAGNLGAAFNSKNGTPARVLWPSVETSEAGITQEMANLVKDISEQINKGLI
jgi:hypothetical protein